MFHTSSQRKHWMFRNEEEIIKLRRENVTMYADKHGDSMQVEDRPLYFLTYDEERLLCRHYEHLVRDFCRKFDPPMPPSVLGTSCAYFKRFYIHNTAMDYHPKWIMYTCIYLACKVEEFNVSIMQFVGNLPNNREKATELILNHELLIMQHLNFNLTVHNPFRPLEGFLIDIKTRVLHIADTEVLRKKAEEFIYRSLATDACLLFAPSQIALAAVLHSASKKGVNLDKYVTDSLVGKGNSDTLKQMVEQLKKVRFMVKHIEPLNPTKIQELEEKLQKCRNQELDPESQIYKKKLEEKLLAEEEETYIKRQLLSEETKRSEDQFLMSV
ncbi:cyclin-H-like [Saccoglossus kowalevskii]|uniref:Cyclin-H n=1 Tax=Saccoglossus kowalevskii TaxID=10224 RepID=A0ABM0MTD8_SACKO|nr:PREDICTED: cyclin-H-like [Saccoglossus kowalevskii]